jgi:hypothetical protein
MDFSSSYQSWIYTDFWLTHEEPQMVRGFKGFYFEMKENDLHGFLAETHEQANPRNTSHMDFWLRHE